MKIGRGAGILKIVKLEILQSAPNDPKPKIKESGIKSSLEICEAPTMALAQMKLVNNNGYHMGFKGLKC